MGYINEKGEWERFGTSPVSGAYWKMCDCQLCVMDRTELIARGAAEQLLKHQDEMVREMMISSAVPPLTDLTSNHLEEKSPPSQS